MAKPLVIISDFDPVTTSFIIQHLDNSTGLFQGDHDEAEHFYPADGGTTYAFLRRTPAGDTLHLTFKRARPKLKVMSCGQR